MFIEESDIFIFECHALVMRFLIINVCDDGRQNRFADAEECVTFLLLEIRELRVFF